MAEAKKLQRSGDEAIAGVCAGIADRFDVGHSRRSHSCRSFRHCDVWACAAGVCGYLACHTQTS